MGKNMILFIYNYTCIKNYETMVKYNSVNYNLLIFCHGLFNKNKSVDAYLINAAYF